MHDHYEVRKTFIEDQAIVALSMFGSMTIINIYILIKYIRKLEEKNFHLSMIGMMQACYFLLCFLYGSSLWFKVEDDRGDAECEQGILSTLNCLAKFVREYKTQLRRESTAVVLYCVLSSLTCSVFSIKYWVLA